MSREPFDIPGPGRLWTGGVSVLVAVVEALAFWATIAFPMVYLGGYLATVLRPDLALPSVTVMGAILGANVLVLVVGHRHDGLADRSGPDSPARHPGQSPPGD